jgi:uncharacterized protein with HEPN domain
MYDREVAKEILAQMLTAVDRIQRRASGITSANDFVTSEEGIDKFDAIGMMLIALGESCKNLDKVTKGEVLPEYPQVDWKGVMGLRDIMSHHYFDANAEAIFGVCKKRIPALKAVLETMLQELN